ncbi:hypothetical protein BJ170DRAFT_600171 [Xylariales sp. AK1849]|nr:hypothetical protein BJ170DRAFT_600171 [Xylariales sp. AK1849]
MRSTSFTAALAALALGASAQPLGYDPDCDCSKQGAGGTCSIERKDPDPSKPSLKFTVTCNSQCKTTVGGTDVEFKYYSSVTKGSQYAKDHGLDPWVCHDTLKDAFCTFDWYGVNVLWRPVSDFRGRGRKMATGIWAAS